jgi:hypothetical protein
VWRCIPVIPALGRMRQEDHEFDITLLHSEILFQKKKLDITKLYIVFMFLFIEYRTHENDHHV